MSRIGFYFVTDKPLSLTGLWRKKIFEAATLSHLRYFKQPLTVASIDQ